MPYNNNFPTANCSGAIQRYYAGCATIAAAQVVTYYRKYPLTWNFAGYNAQPHIYSSNVSLATSVAGFVKSVANELDISYSCGGTGVPGLKTVVNAFTRWGYNCERQITNDVDKNKPLIPQAISILKESEFQPVASLFIAVHHTKIVYCELFVNCFLTRNVPYSRIFATTK